MESALTICWGEQTFRLYTGYNFSSSQKHKAVIPTKVGAEKSMYGKMGVWGRISALPLLFPSARRFTSASGPSNKRYPAENCPLCPSGEMISRT